MKRQKIFRILFVISAIVFLISAGVLLSYWWSYHQADSEYDQIAGEAVKIRQSPESGQQPQQSAGKTVSGGVPDLVEDKNPPALVIDFHELVGTNEDTVAWIDFPGQDVSYPVVQYEDNDRYLHWTFNGTRNSSGAIFADSRNDGLMIDGNTIIYGHNMKNGSMFGFLKKYLHEDYYQQFPYFDVYAPEGVYRCAIISCAQIRAIEDNYQILFTDEQDRQNYINKIKASEGYSIDPIESDASVPIAEYALELVADGESADGTGADGQPVALQPEPADGETKAGNEGAKAGSGAGVQAGEAKAGSGAEAGGTKAKAGEASDGAGESTDEDSPEADGAPPLVLLSTCTGSSHAYRFVVLAQVQKFYPAE